MASLKDSLIAHYKMNDNAATAVVVDETGNHNGTYKDTGGDLNTDTGASTGKILGALDFDGGDEYVAIADHDDFDVSTISISIWINPDNFDAVRYLIAKLEDTNSEISYGIIIETQGKVRFFLSTNGTSFQTKDSSTEILTAGEWNHIVVTYKEGVGVKFYVNGAFDKLDASETGALYTGTGRLTIGARYDSSEGIYKFFFGGLIDNPMFFNKELTLLEVKYLYNGGIGRENISVGSELSRTGHSFSSRQEI